MKRAEHRGSKNCHRINLECSFGSFRNHRYILGLEDKP